ncbi:MAG TPA: ABC transporter permease [Coriobacteriia bacterium]|nr:ABC transporter permease [Coriobacteriia bacterium]
MSLSRMWKVLKKDLALGPRSPIFLWAIVLPFALTLIMQVAFGSLFDPEPRLGIVDEGDSEITASIEGMEGIELTLLDDAEELKAQVEANDLDAGLVLGAGFDDAVRSGEKPTLEFYISGESYASNRIILSVTTIDLVRELEGGEAPVTVDIVNFGRAGLPISVRLVPLLVFYALVIAGLFVPGSNIVEEKEQGTLMAMLVTPVRTAEILVAKWLLGAILATILAVVTLALNGAVGPNWFHVVIVVIVAAMLSAMLGVVAGVFAKDSSIMFGIVKGTGIFLFAPALFYIFPEWPQWIAKLFPLYWIINPIWQVSVMGESISTVWGELAVAIAITAALGALAWTLARRMQAQMAGQ